MKNSIQLTQLELVLLKLVAKGEGHFSWYELANSLSRLDVPREHDMMTVLKNLVAKGLLKRTIETEFSKDKWQLTPIGRNFLANNINP